MAKPHRGKGIRHLPNRGKGTCPYCKRTNVKLLYERVTEGGATVKVCKKCRRKK